jgi:acyl carrier protein
VEKKEVVQKLREFVTTELMQNPIYALKEDEMLFSTGTLDSFAIAQIGVFIETDFDLYIPDADLTVENMDTVGMMADSVIAGLEAQED